MAKFSIGQRVVCVRDNKQISSFLKSGSVYIVTKENYMIGELNCIKVKGSSSPWVSNRFAPIEPRKATVDAECLTAYEVVPETIAPVKVKEVENV